VENIKVNLYFKAEEFDKLQLIASKYHELVTRREDSAKTCTNKIYTGLLTIEDLFEAKVCLVGIQTKPKSNMYLSSGICIDGYEMTIELGPVGETK